MENFNKPSQKVLDRQQKYIDSAKKKKQAILASNERKYNAINEKKTLESMRSGFDGFAYLEEKFGSNQKN
jgi:hypothetical protein